MTTADVWAATHDLAEQWRQSALIQRFAEQLPANNPSNNGIPEMLRNLDAGTQLVSGQPLIPNGWEAFAQQIPWVTLDVNGLEFLASAQPIGFAAELQTAWLRSRLPRYPMIPAPHLAPDTHRTTFEIGRDLAWRREALQGGLQFEATPRGIDQLLGIEQRSYNQAIHALADALQGTDEWTSFASRSTELTGGSRRELVEARRRLRVLLSEAAVDDHEPTRMARREDYRRHQVATVISDLSDPAREYAAAFERVDELIDWVSLRVLGQAVAYGRPTRLTEVDEVEREGITIRFHSNTTFPRTALVQIDHPLVPDLAFVTGMSFHFDERGTNISKYEAKILAGSAGLFDLESMP